jgi:geranylgeranylglycerol-phosphate geranylgeranyltransferase
MTKIIDLIKLTRIEHSIMLAIAVLIGEIISAQKLPESSIVLLSFIPAILLGMASFSINDYFDLKSDRINKRFDRPLVAGKISPKFAHNFAIALFLVGILTSFVVNLNAFIITTVFAFLSYLYSYKLKDIAFIGNVYIAMTMAIPFIYGNFVVNYNLDTGASILGLIAFTTGLAREITGTIRDIGGDKKARGSKTLPIITGIKNSAYIASFLYIIAIILGLIPYLYISNYRYKIYYIIPVIITDVILIYIALNIIRNQKIGFLKKCRNLSLLAMFIGLLGFLFGALA